MVAPIVNVGIQTSKVRILEYTFQMKFIDCNYSSIAMVRELRAGAYTILILNTSSGRSRSFGESNNHGQYPLLYSVDF
jgi:hypothetical protein